MTIFNFKTATGKIAVLGAIVIALAGLGLVAFGTGGGVSPVPGASVAARTSKPKQAEVVMTNTALASTDTRVVMVSGRDDHGLVETPHVPIYRAPDETVETSRLHNGAFAKVLEIRGNWLHIQAVAPPYEIGWIDDYYLRGKALRADGGGQVEFAAARFTNEQVFVAVYPIGLRTAPVTWLPQAQLREIGSR